MRRALPMPRPRPVPALRRSCDPRATTAEHATYPRPARTPAEHIEGGLRITRPGALTAPAHHHHGLRNCGDWAVDPSPGAPVPAGSITSARLAGISQTLVSAGAVFAARRGWCLSGPQIPTPRGRREFRPLLSGQRLRNDVAEGFPCGEPAHLLHDEVCSLRIEGG